jgi:hypothetical protein
VDGEQAVRHRPVLRPPPPVVVAIDYLACATGWATMITWRVVITLENRGAIILDDGMLRDG